MRFHRRTAAGPVASLTLLLLVCVLFLAALGESEADQKEVTKEPAAAAKQLADELPRIPGIEPADALKTFKLEHGFTLQLVASEPMVADPVDACFDADGRMYVAEMHGYPFSAEPTTLNPKGGGKPNDGIVRLLEDTDGDGKMDQSKIFGDGISWPVSVCPYDGGVFILAPPHLHFFKDTNGDGVADVRRIVLSGFRRDNVQALANNLKWALENRIYLAGGRNGGELTRQGATIFTIRGQDISFDPVSEKIEPLTGGDQWGHSMDDWGRRFICNNSNHIEQVVFPDRYLRRNPYFAVSGAIRTIAKEGPAAPVFRRSAPEPWRVVRTRMRVADPKIRSGLPFTEQFATGFFTSAAGVTIYRGAAYPPEFRGNAIIGDVGGNLIHRKRIRQKGAGLVAERADENTEFVTSTDNWFRPVNFVNAPDGTLCVLDMYRETIEHPASIPEEIKQHLDLESGNERGRIYRLVSPNMERIKPPKLSAASSADLVKELESENSWNRETAQRLLYERQDKSVVDALRELVRSSRSPLGRLHALYTLDGLGALTPEIVVPAIKDESAGVRIHAARLSEKFLEASPEAAAPIVALVDDADLEVVMQAAFSLGFIPADKGVEGLAKLARRASDDELIRSAMMTSVAGNAGKLVAELLSDEKFRSEKGTQGLISDLVSIVGAQPDSKPALDVLETAAQLGNDLLLQQRVVRALGEGLTRRGSSMAKVLADAPQDSKVRQSIETLFQKASEIAGNDTNETPSRVAAVGLLAFDANADRTTKLAELLSPQVPQPLQLASVAALSSHEGREVGALILGGWKTYSPQVRRDVIDSLLRSRDRIETLLAAVDTGEVLRAEIERDKKQILLNHPEEAIRNRSKQLFEAELAGDRAKAVASYQSVLTLSTDAMRGRAVFEKTCATCHRVGSVGHAVGPDLASTQNKSPADLLVAILDPNREAQPNFNTYTVVTQQGTLLTGLVASETATSVTLRRAEAKEDVVLRNNIDTMVSNGKSLMPEGLEKEISAQQMADLIAFLKSIPAATSP
ncbi:MAG: PVC-type heme-binding CxxCH protein, partial [Planctomycetaceae bacterium]